MVGNAVLTRMAPMTGWVGGTVTAVTLVPAPLMALTLTVSSMPRFAATGV
jgi:hypothetical protein